MMTKKTLIFPIMLMLAVFFSTQLWAETDCSQKAIGYYLDKGFTPAQISQMCQSTTNSAAVTPPATQGETVLPNDNEKEVVSQEGVDTTPLNDDLLFFNRVIVADSLTVTPETLSYVRDECVSYGEDENMDDSFSNQAKVCGKLKTTINRIGLIVVRAVSGISLFRDAELLVKGDIQREVINPSLLSSRDRQTFEKIFETAPEVFNIKFRKDADPKEIGARLSR